MRELEDRAERMEFYEWMMLIFIIILFAVAGILIIIGIYSDSIDKIAGLLGGSGSGAMFVFPYNKLEKFANKRKFLSVAGLFLDKFPDLADREFVNRVLDRIIDG